MQEIRAHEAQQCGVRRNKCVLAQKRSGVQLRVAIAERVHFLLQCFRVFLHADFGVPDVKHVPVRVLRFLPYGGIFGLDGGDELLRFFRDFQLRMHGREQNEMELDHAQFRSLPVDRPVSSEKYDDVERDDSERDDGPPAPLHVFMTQRNQHLRVSIQEARRVTFRRLCFFQFKRP